MPAVQPGSKVLVTGANGFVAMWVVRLLLEEGFRVRGTIRAPEKGMYMKELFKEYGDKLELVVVPNIEKEGAFDEAVKGVHAIEHLASPYHYQAKDPAELIGPAIRGTAGILQSALKYGLDVKRVVVTTSTAAVVRPTETPITFTEADWNDSSIEEVEQKGAAAPGYMKYFASKTLAEKAAFDFLKKHESEVKWDLVTIAPPYVFGPIINEVTTVSSSNTSIVEWYETILESSKGTDPLTDMGDAWLDVRDLALAHIRAIERPEAQGRIIVSAESFKWHDFLTVARSLTPNPYSPQSYTEPAESYDPKQAVHLLNFDTSKAAKVLGIDKYISMEQCTRDMLEDFKRRGW